MLDLLSSNNTKSESFDKFKVISFFSPFIASRGSSNHIDHVIRPLLDTGDLSPTSGFPISQKREMFKPFKLES